MKLKIILSFIFLNFHCFAMETQRISSGKEEVKDFPEWSKLPKEMQTEIMANLFEFKGKTTEENVINSYKKYLNFKEVNKQFRDELFPLYKKFLFKNLSQQDFKNLNKYVLKAVSLPQLPKDTEALIRLLIDLNKLDTTMKDTFGANMLLWASQNGHIYVATLLIGAGADVNAAAGEKWTPLMGASMNGHTHIVKLLINNGADINAKNIRSKTALDLANSYGKKEVVKLIEDKMKEQK